MLKKLLISIFILTISTNIFSLENNKMQEENINDFVYEWFSLFDQEAPSYEFEQRMTKTPYFQFPETTLESISDFRLWYKDVLNKFKNPTHKLKEINITQSKDGYYIVNLVVLWKATTKKTNKPVKFEAKQRWELVMTRSKFKINKYLVKANN